MNNLDTSISKLNNKGKVMTASIEDRKLKLIITPEDHSFSPDQQVAYDELLKWIKSDSRSITINGPAGSGKSYLIQCLCRDFEYDIAKTAMTNCAAKIIDGSTTHSCMEIRPKRDNKTGLEVFSIAKSYNRTSRAIILIDEASMVSSAFMDMIIDETKHRFIFVGDRHQLPPIGEDLSDVFLYGTQLNLTTLHRQEKGSSIIKQSKNIREGKSVVFGGDVEKRVDGKTWLDDFNRDNDLICSWTNKASMHWNHIIEPKPFEVGSKVLTIDTIVFKCGKKPIVINGSSELMIVDLIRGRFESIDGQFVRLTAGNVIEDDYHEEEDDFRDMGLLRNHVFFLPDLLNDAKVAIKSCAKRCKSIGKWSTYFELKDKLVDLRYPFSVTTHKAQGQTVDRVYIDMRDMTNCRKVDYELFKKLFYVSLTRAKYKAIILTGD